MEMIQDKGERIPSQKQDNKNIKINEEEVAASPIGTHPDDMVEDVSDTKDDRTHHNIS